MDYTRARSNMVENQLRPNRIEDRRVLDAMRTVPRERFVPAALRGVAYGDEDLTFPDGRTLIEPLGLARIIQAGQIEPGDVTLVLGCVTGYATAVVARLAGTVILVQPDAEAAGAIETLLDDVGVDNVVVTVNPDPLGGHPSQAPFDLIIVAGAVTEVPRALLEQLGEGGRLVAVLDQGRVGKGTVFTRIHGAFGSRVVFDAAIPPLPGLQRTPAFAF
jgi:protein-L-isoaspartate(D-aspartate) O-methyltransferase